MNDLILYHEYPACNIYYNVELGTICQVWKGIFVSGDELKKIFNEIIALLLFKNCNVILTDARKMKIISEEDQEWIIKDWYERAVEVGLNREILIVLKNSFGERSLKQIVKHYDKEIVKTTWFTSHLQAIECLEKFRNLKSKSNI